MTEEPKAGEIISTEDDRRPEPEERVMITWRCQWHMAIYFPAYMAVGGQDSFEVCDLGGWDGVKFYRAQFWMRLPELPKGYIE